MKTALETLHAEMPSRSAIMDQQNEFINVQTLSPLPQKLFRFGTKRRRSSKATLLTESPYKRLVATATNPPSGKVKAAKVSAVKRTANKSGKATKTVYSCLVCNESVDHDWIQCAPCKQWAHEACANISNPKYYYCDNCC